MSRNQLAAAITAAALFAVLPASASAAKASKKDPDRDGLSNKVEKRLRTNARRADTDRDRLKDGVEVRLGTNPRVKDTDRDGVSDGREVAAGTDPCPGRSRYDLHGTVDSVGSDSVTIARRDGTTATLTVNAATRLRIPDADENGKVTLDDLLEGDRVNARRSAADRTLAISISVEGEYEEGDEVEGIVDAIGESSITVSDEDGTTTSVNVNEETELRAPDRDGNEKVTLADIIVGDKVEVYLSASDPTLAVSVKVEFEADKVFGLVASVGANSVTITLADTTQTTVTVNSSTKLRIPGPDGAPDGTLDDLRVGDPIKVKTIPGAGDTTLAVFLSAGEFAVGRGHGHGRGHDRGEGRGRGGDRPEFEDRPEYEDLPEAEDGRNRGRPGGEVGIGRGNRGR